MREIPPLSASPLAREVLTPAKVLYTDIDGTLLGRGGCLLCDLDGDPSLDGARAVAALNEAGLPVVIVSGRTVPMLKEISRMLGWSDFLAESGAVRAYDRGSELVYETGDWPADAVPEGSTPYEVIRDSGVIEALFAEFPGKLEYHSPHHTGREATHLLRGEVDNAAAQTVLDRFDPAMGWLDNGVIDPPRTGLADVETVHAYHLMPAGTSKVAAIQADLARRGLAAEDAVMIGDSEADLAVHRTVGLMVLVRNALRSPAVLEAGPRIENLVVTDGSAGSGWAELANAWLAARAGS